MHENLTKPYKIVFLRMVFAVVRLSVQAAIPAARFPVFPARVEFNISIVISIASLAFKEIAPPVPGPLAALFVN